MKNNRLATLAVVLSASAVLAGCVVAPGYDRPPPPRHGDRDRDGVPDRHDRRPNNPYRH